MTRARHQCFAAQLSNQANIVNANFLHAGCRCLHFMQASTLVNDVKLPFLFKLYGRALLMTNFLLGGLLNKLVPSVMPLGSPLFKDVRDPRVSFSKALRSAQLMLAGMVLGVTLGVAKLVL